MKSCIITDSRWKRFKQMLCQHTCPRIKFDIAIKYKASIAYDSNSAAVYLTTLHVVLVQVFIIIGIETTARNLVKPNDVSLGYQCWLRRIGVTHKQLWYGDRSSCQESAIRAEFCEAERLPCLPWPKF